MFLLLLSSQEGAPDEEIERLSKFKFLTVKNSEKVNGEVRETQGGIMTELGVDSQTERVIASDDAVSEPTIKIPFFFFLLSTEFWMLKILKMIIYNPIAGM